MRRPAQSLVPCAVWNAHDKPTRLPDLDALMTRIGRENCSGLETHLRIVGAFEDLNRLNTLATHQKASIGRHDINFQAGRPLIPMIGCEIEQLIAVGLSSRKIFARDRHLPDAAL